MTGDPTERALIEAARESLTGAHAPYSDYPVGAAIETADGTVHTGCNIETANFSNTLHAEEVALASAIEAGHTAFRRLAVSSGRQDGVTPCGMCRQTLAEFCGDDLEILCDEGDEVSRWTLGELLPAPIDRDHLE